MKDLRNRADSGQAFTEYLLLISVILGIYLGVTQGLARLRIQEKWMAGFHQQLRALYQFGHVKAKGFENGGPTYHPRAFGGDNFRIFLNVNP